MGDGAPVSSVRLFDHAELDRYVANALANQVPEGHTSAIVGAVDSNGAQIVIALDKKTSRGEWQARAMFRHEWTNATTIGASLIYSF